ncbi:MAG: SBBP repeat-containing protein, partial [candidate division WOR-3 bacterium]
YLSFEVGRYDKKETLVIDPVLTAILASSGYDEARSLAIDLSGNVFVAGYSSNSSSFAPSRNFFGTTGYYYVFVSKLSNDLSTHIATAILASSGDDYAYSVAIDGSGNVFVAGYTYNSSDFAPSRNVFGTTGSWDVFVSKLSNDLRKHIATAILTSSDGDYAYSLAIDGSGNVFVAGWTYNSSNFSPGRNVFGTTGYYDVFVSKLRNDLSTHIATAILTSSDYDYAYSLAVDRSGNVFVAGATGNSSDFAPSRNVFGTIRKEMVLGCLAAFAPIINVFSTIGSPDAFVIRLSNELK